MIKSTVRTLILLATSALSVAALSTEAQADACAPVRRVCFAAGFKAPKPGASTAQITALRSQGVDLTANCMRPILKNQSPNIAGAASLTSAQISQCQTLITSQVQALKPAGSD